MAFKLDDLTGKRFGKLTVLERCYDMPKRGSTVYWKCITIFYKGIMPSETGFRFSSGL